MVKVEKPKGEDLPDIEEILNQWTEEEEVDKYIERIGNEIDGHTEFNMQFWVARDNDKVIGIIGLSNPLPKVIPLAKTQKPGEIKILYVDNKEQGKGIGRTLVGFIENEAKRQGYKELLVRSAERYKNTTWGFYKKLGYSDLGIITGGDNKKKMQVFEKIL